MLTIGVDLAAAPKKTGLAAIEWSRGHAALRLLKLAPNDAEIVAESRDATTIGIDCPFGWPVEFVEFVSAHIKSEVAPRTLAGADWRRQLAYRETDRFVREHTGRWPLSVSTDRLGLTAMHCAELLEEFANAGEIVDRSGRGRLVEVYPGAAVRFWGLTTAGYKSDVNMRAIATNDLIRQAPWLHIEPDSIALMSRSDDAFDAVIAALNARAHALGLTTRIPDALLAAAKSEGWTALPTAPLEVLID